MNLYKLLYTIIIVPSFLLFGYCCYLLCFHAPSTMNKYTYMLFIIAVSALVESFYFGIAMMPGPIFEPIVMICADGFMSSWTNTSVGFQWGISTILDGQIVSSIGDALLYRYWIVMTSTGTKAKKSLLFALSFITHGIASGVCCPLSAYSFLDDKQTRALVRNVTFPQMNVGALQGPMLYPWVITLAASIVVLSCVFSVLCFRIDHRLKHCALSTATKKMHKELVFGINLTTYITGVCALIPAIMLSVYFILGGVPNAEFHAQYALPVFTAKSLGSSIIIILTVPQFRRHIPSLLGCHKRQERPQLVTVAPTSVSDGTTISTETQEMN